MSALKYDVGQWVEVTVRREGGPDLVRVGKITEADRDHAVVTCRTGDTDVQFIWSDDTAGHILLRKMTPADWQARKRRRRS